MQKELYQAFAEQDFQDALEEVEAQHGKGYEGLTRHHTELFLSVQNQILPKYGYDEGQRGVSQMFQDVSRFNSDMQFQRNRFMLNQMLGLLSPEEEEDGEDQEEIDEPSADSVEVVVNHFTEGTTTKVVVPLDATFHSVREALARKVGDPQVLDKGRLMRKQEGTFSAYNDKDLIGSVREVILLKAGPRQQQQQQQQQHDATPEEDDGGTAAPKSRELPIIPETGFRDEVNSNASSRVASITTVGTPKSIPASHLDSVANSVLRAEIDRDSLDGRSLGVISTCGTYARPLEDDARSVVASISESRLDSQNYLADLDKMVQDDRKLGSKRRI